MSYGRLAIPGRERCGKTQQRVSMKVATLLTTLSPRFTYEMRHKACIHSEFIGLTGGDAIRITTLMRKATAFEFRNSLVGEPC